MVELSCCCLIFSTPVANYLNDQVKEALSAFSRRLGAADRIRIPPYSNWSLFDARGLIHFLVQSTWTSILTIISHTVHEIWNPLAVLHHQDGEPIVTLNALAPLHGLRLWGDHETFQSYSKCSEYVLVSTRPDSTSIPYTPWSRIWENLRQNITLSNADDELDRSFRREELMVVTFSRSPSHSVFPCSVIARFWSSSNPALVGRNPVH